MRVGIFGGAFNPPHVGHLICAQEAHGALGLDSVAFVPVGEAPHREIDQDPGAAVRARLCDYATEGDPRLEVSRVEIDREGPSYTADTLRRIREADPDHELSLILGADQASHLTEWREPEEVLALARVAVAAREGIERESVLRRLGALPGATGITFFRMPRVDISSTLVRERVAAGESVRYLVPDRVAAYIGEKGLYGTTAAPTAGVG